MSGLYTNGMPDLAQLLYGGAAIPMDTGFSGGENPETVGIGVDRLGLLISYITNNVDRATVAGSRYYRQWTVPYNIQANGVAFLVGSTGGTDKIIVELHNSAGALVATSDITSTAPTLGTANTWQEIPFGTAAAGAVPVQILAGTYYIAIQSNGTTGKLRAYQSAGLSLPVGSATGTFGTSAAITPPTTYTAGVGPVCFLY